MCRFVSLYWFGTAAVTAFCVGCSSGPTEPEDLLPFEGNLLIGLRESHGDVYTEDVEPKPTLGLSTEKTYGCGGYSLRTEISQWSAGMAIRITGVVPPRGACPTIIAPATARIDFDVPNGIYSLFVQGRGMWASYRIVVTDSILELIPEDTSFTIPVSGLVWRYPRDSFGYYCNTGEEGAWLCDAFLDTLENLQYLEKLEVPEEGEWPYPLPGEYSSYTIYPRFFRYEIDNDFEAVTGELKEFSENVLSKSPATASLWLVSWRNEWVRSSEFTG